MPTPNLNAIIRARYRQQDTTNFDGRRMRTTIQRKALDYSSFLIKNGIFSNRIVGRVKEGEVVELEDVHLTYEEIKKRVPQKKEQNINNPLIHTKLHHTSINKLKAPINTLSYTPDGRRLLTGNASGEFTLWNTFTHSFETIMQAHDSPIRKITFSNDGNLILSGDNNGTIKFWYLSLNNVQIRKVSDTSIRDLSTGENIFISGGDDAIIRVHDYNTLNNKLELKGHNWDIRVCQLNPYSSIILSGGKDNLIKLWDIRTNKEIQTLHNHKNTILSGKWLNKNVFFSTSKDCTIREWDIRNLKEELYVYRSKRECTCIGIQPEIGEINKSKEKKKINKKINTIYFAVGQSDGTISFYARHTPYAIDLKPNTNPNKGFFNITTQNEENSVIDKQDLLTMTHTSTVWDICFHPIGHLMASGSMDMTVKVWGWGDIEEEEVEIECVSVPGLE